MPRSNLDAPPPRIALIISSLETGGAQRTLLAVASHLSTRWDVTVITLDSEDTDCYEIPTAVARKGLGVVGEPSGSINRLISRVRRLRRLRRVLRSVRPEVVLSFMDTTNILTLLATAGHRTPVVVSERIDPRPQDERSLMRMSRRRLYPRAAGVVVQTEEQREWALAFAKSSRVHVIPNHADPAPPGWKRRESPLVVGMGRLTHQKGFDVLISAFDVVRRDHPEWRLIIFGDGPDRPVLESQVAELGLGGLVEMPGWAPDAAAALGDAAVFVLPSRFEGFPNVLIEAMALSVPVIASDCPTGPRDIVRAGVDGVLVGPDSVPALAVAMNDLMTRPEERARLAERAGEVVARFHRDRLMGSWESVLAAARHHRQ